MEYIDQQGTEACDPGFAQQIRGVEGANLDRCYQCLTCSLSCPVNFAMDYLPHRIMRMCQLGLKQWVLNSSTIWICAACETCVTRCPNEVDILRIMDTLRETALREKVVGKESSIPVFHQIFLSGIEQTGRQYELGMILRLKLKFGDFFSDIGLGIKMLLKGKLKLLPSRIKGAREVKSIMQRAR